MIVVCKPTGLLSQGDASGDYNLLDLLKAHIKKKEAKPGACFLGLVHRLDKVASGESIKLVRMLI
jgi:23S rRNA pseudouridine1911/1915/1917 synthase